MPSHRDDSPADPLAHSSRAKRGEISVRRGKEELARLADVSPRDVPGRLAKAIEDVLSRIPRSDEGPSPDPQARARRIAASASARAAVVSGSLALPPGPLGLITLVPDLMAIWRIQSQMVVDIAAVYGIEAPPTREQMIYCLFRQAAAQAVRDIAARVGGRVIVKAASSRVVETTLRKVGLRLSQRLVAGAAARWLPIVGAVGVGAYAYWDTAQVARTAIGLFGRTQR